MKNIFLVLALVAGLSACNCKKDKVEEAAKEVVVPTPKTEVAAPAEAPAPEAPAADTK